MVLIGIAARSAAWLNAAIDPQMDARNWFIRRHLLPDLGGSTDCSAASLWPCENLSPITGQERSAMPTSLCSRGLPCWRWRSGCLLIAPDCWPTPSAGPCSFGLALLVFAGAGRNGIVGGRAVPGAGWLAAISYSLYLVHKAMYHLVQAHWGRTVAGTGRVCLCGLWCNGYCGRCRAALSHRTAVPAMAWPVCRSLHANRWRRQRRSKPGAVAHIGERIARLARVARLPCVASRRCGTVPVPRRCGNKARGRRIDVLTRRRSR